MSRIPNSVANSLEINLSLLLDHQTLMKITCPSRLSKKCFFGVRECVSHLADTVAWVEKKCVDGSMGSSLIREIGRTAPERLCDGYSRGRKDEKCSYCDVGDVLAYARSRVLQKICTKFTYYDVAVATTSAKNINALNRVLVPLCTRGNPKDGAARTLRRLVEEETCDLSGEAFARLMDHLYECITTFLDNNEVSENLGALRDIYELIDVSINENASKVTKFINYTFVALKQSVILKSRSLLVKFLVT
ncbi:hypothetical protein MTR67_039124 [Solanum verrucosum]|uniref:Uncharacterized protein n=1 Tax=Solanum verrucosum TaxID=315347 RepID=A0AAF0ZQW1_SOLVR|nr:hypothetical protein MTR67_039124 [Solanum verrucosum]